MLGSAGSKPTAETWATSMPAARPSRPSSDRVETAIRAAEIAAAEDDSGRPRADGDEGARPRRDSRWSRWQAMSE